MPGALYAIPNVFWNTKRSNRQSDRFGNADALSKWVRNSWSPTHEWNLYDVSTHCQVKFRLVIVLSVLLSNGKLRENTGTRVVVGLDMPNLRGIEKQRGIWVIRDEIARGPWGAMLPMVSRDSGNADDWSDITVYMCNRLTDFWLFAYCDDVSLWRQRKEE